MCMKSIVVRSILMSLFLLCVAYGQGDLQAKLRNEFLKTTMNFRFGVR